MLTDTMNGEEWHLVARVEPMERLKLIKPSGIRRFSALAQKLPACVNLSIGEPDFCVPVHALNGARKQLDKAEHTTRQQMGLLSCGRR